MWTLKLTISLSTEAIVAHGSGVARSITLTAGLDPHKCISLGIASATSRANTETSLLSLSVKVSKGT